MEPQTKAAGLGLVALELVLAPNYQEPQSFESLELLVVLGLGLPSISDPGAALGLAFALDFHLASAGKSVMKADFMTLLSFIIYTGGHVSSYPWFSGNHFDCFNHLL